MSSYSSFSNKASVKVPPSPKHSLTPILLFLVVVIGIFATSYFWRELIETPPETAVHTLPPTPLPLKPPPSERQEVPPREEGTIPAEINATYEWVVLATSNAATVCKNLAKIPLAERIIVIAKQDKLSTELQQEMQQNLNQLRDRVNNVMNGYIENIKMLAIKDESIINKAIGEYRIKLTANQEHDKLKILDKAIYNHLNQYTRYNKIDLEQWKADLERL
jgi:hypothetical protein